jgi:hypothetical protein
LNRYLKSVPGFDAGIVRLSQFCPAIFVVFGMMARGAVLLHPHATFADYPNAYRVFMQLGPHSETVTALLELGGGTLLLLGGLYVRYAEKGAVLTLRWVQFGFFLAMLGSGGLGGMMLFADPLAPGWCWFFGRSFLAGVVVLQLCSEIEFKEGRERRFRERRLLEAPDVPTRAALRQMSDAQLKQRFLKHRQLI